jgi:hypothetical protein
VKPQPRVDAVPLFPEERAALLAERVVRTVSIIA